MRRTCNVGSGVLSCWSSCLKSCFPINVNKEVGSLVKTHAMQFGGCEFRRQASPDGNGEVLRGRNLGEELGYLLVQEAMVERVEHFPAHYVFQLFQVNHES